MLVFIANAQPKCKLFYALVSKCVIVPGLNEGILPRVNSVEQLVNLKEEERRLMHVAMTPAMKRLIITYRKRQMGQPITVASRFLREIGE
jgi:superfamily I DNA/RNA helicase